jgi:hypothetical protein
MIRRVALIRTGVTEELTRATRHNIPEDAILHPISHLRIMTKEMKKVDQTKRAANDVAARKEKMEGGKIKKTRERGISISFHSYQGTCLQRTERYCNSNLCSELVTVFKPLCYILSQFKQSTEHRTHSSHMQLLLTKSRSKGNRMNTNMV